MTIVQPNKIEGAINNITWMQDWILKIQIQFNDTHSLSLSLSADENDWKGAKAN